MKTFLRSSVALTFFYLAPLFSNAFAADSQTSQHRGIRNSGDFSLGLTLLALATPSRIYGNLQTDPYGVLGIFAGYKFSPAHEIQLFAGSMNILNNDSSLGASYRFFLLPENVFSPLVSIGYTHEAYNWTSSTFKENTKHTTEWLSLGLAVNCTLQNGFAFELGVRVHAHTKKSYDEDGKEFSNHISFYPQFSYHF